MKTERNWLVTALAAFTGGFCAGLMLAPKSGHDLRRSISVNVQAQTRRMGEQLHDLEARLQHLERQLQESGEHFATAVREARDRAVEHYIPEPGPWELESEEVAEDLRRMPHE